MKRNYFSKVFQASLLCCLAVFFTACDEFGSEDNPTPAYLQLSEAPVTIKAGDTYKRKAISVTSAIVEYTSSDTNVATVNGEGLVTAIAEGTTTITATATGYSSQTGKKIFLADSKSYVVTVTPGAAPAPASMLETPLTLEALGTGTIVVSRPQGGLQYSKNGGDKTAVTHNAAIDVAIGDKVSFYGNCTKIFLGGINGGTKFNSGTADVKVYGNIMSLLDATGFATATTLTADYAFMELFQDYSHLIDAGDLQLPATTITNNCYKCMFENCPNLTTAPKKLPAMELKSECYNQMFWGCTSLTKTPELPATTLEAYCYYKMFKNCTGLTTAYVKAAYTVGDNECFEMFYGCTTAGAVLHTTTANKTSWDGVMGSTWATWTAVGDWND